MEKFTTFNRGTPQFVIVLSNIKYIGLTKSIVMLWMNFGGTEIGTNIIMKIIFVKAQKSCRNPLPCHSHFLALLLGPET